MDELKTLSSVFNFFKWTGLIVGCVCFFFAFFISVDGGKSEALTLFWIGIFGYITLFSCCISKVLTDALNHIVTAARMYTNN